LFGLMLFATELAVAEANEGIEQAGELVGVFLKGVAQGAGIEVEQQIQEIGGGDLDGGLIEGAAVFASEIGGHLIAGVLGLNTVLLAQLFLVTAHAPVAEVFLIEVFAVVAKGGGDVGVGKAIQEHLVYAVANGFWFAGDFAFAAVAGGD
jgi:hypothetical protein